MQYVARRFAMNYIYIESLVKQCKSNDEFSKELLAEQFKPFIINISGKTFIHGYDRNDIINECYKYLFHCVKLYNPEKHRFVAYATNGIKNNLKDLISKHKRRSSSEGSEALTFTNNLELYLQNEERHIDENLCLNADYNLVRIAINELDSLEKELITFVYLNNRTVKEFSKLKNITYNAAITIKNMALDNMFIRLKYFYKI